MQSIGVSAALGAFVAGVMLAESPYRHELEADIDPVPLDPARSVFPRSRDDARSRCYSLRSRLLILGLAATMVAGEDGAGFQLGSACSA
jgi:hypothetical protein